MVEPAAEDFDRALADPAPHRRGKSTGDRAFRSLPVLPVIPERHDDGIWFGTVTVR